MLLVITAIVLAGTAVLNASETAGKTGEQLFKEHCSVCHPDGGNIITPKKTLMKKDLVANNIRSADDMVRTMRTPGPGMTAFDMKTLSDKEARKISDFIFKKYNK